MPTAPDARQRPDAPTGARALRRALSLAVAVCVGLPPAPLAVVAAVYPVGVPT